MFCSAKLLYLGGFPNKTSMSVLAQPFSPCRKSNLFCDRAKTKKRQPAYKTKPVCVRHIPRAPYVLVTSVGRVAAAVIAFAADVVMLADAPAKTLLALSPAAVMLAYARSLAFLALALDALVGAYARPQALLALAPDALISGILRIP